MVVGEKETAAYLQKDDRGSQKCEHLEIKEPRCKLLLLPKRRRKGNEVRFGRKFFTSENPALRRSGLAKNTHGLHQWENGRKNIRVKG